MSSPPTPTAPEPLGSERVAEFQRVILGYLAEQGRDFPWRHTDDPYAILVSEVMLQQTQTDRVLPNYRRWMERFPRFEALAAATLAEVLAEWSGLGYNRRGRFLWEACKVMAASGGFPSTAALLEALPGIGPYTARAVAAFAWNRPEVFIETNIRTVFLFFFFPDASAVVSDAQLLPLIDQTLYRPDPRRWYYGLMDYGAALKKKVTNPNRRSAHYSRQSPFEGSLRQARGAIIRRLTQVTEALTLGDIARLEGIDHPRLEKAAALLVAEGMVHREGDVYRIGGQCK
jgi:A/G-specific adenine glycosylase